MNTAFVRIILVLALSLSATFIQAQEVSKKPLRFDITASKKRLEVEKSENSSTKSTTEKWAYTVTVRNSTFAEQSGLTVQYRIYMRDDNVKQDSLNKLPLRKQEGTETIAVLPMAKSHDFITSSMKIETSDLKGGWIYTDGEKRKDKDTLYGIWIRVVKDNEIVAEFQNPPALKSKVVWE